MTDVNFIIDFSVTFWFEFHLSRISNWNVLSELPKINFIICDRSQCWSPISATSQKLPVFFCCENSIVFHNFGENTVGFSRFHNNKQDFQLKMFKWAPKTKFYNLWPITMLESDFCDQPKLPILLWKFVCVPRFRRTYNRFQSISQ